MTPTRDITFDMLIFLAPMRYARFSFLYKGLRAILSFTLYGRLRLRAL